MSASHKKALAQGRRESQVVNQYLDALAAGKGRRGRKRTPASIDARLERIAGAMGNASHLQQLELIQEKMNLEAEKSALQLRADLSALEKEFVRVAKGFATRRGISYSAFRAKGVAPAVLSKAGVRRTRA